MLERGRLVYSVPGTLGVIAQIPTDGGQGLPNYLLLSTEIDPSNIVPATNVTIHVDQDPTGTGTYTNDVVTAVTIVPGGSVIVKIPYPQGASIQLRGLTASGKPWQLYVDPLTRYGGAQRGD
jgi:hypothetical protein